MDLSFLILLPNFVLFRCFQNHLISSFPKSRLKTKAPLRLSIRRRSISIEAMNVSALSMASFDALMHHSSMDLAEEPGSVFCGVTDVR
jgi:hypothetical protein